MGIDITAYQKIKKVECAFDEEGEPIDRLTREPMDHLLRLWVNPDFPGRANDITESGKSAYFEYKAEEHCYSRGYSGYNHWRDTLAKIAGYPETEFEMYGVKQMRHDAGAWATSSGPFWELINFSDCEGVIGTAVSAKLAEDFAAFQEKADSVDDARFKEGYASLRRAFEIAKDSGAVKFH